MGKHEKKDPPNGDGHDPNHPPPPGSGRPGKHRKTSLQSECRLR